MNDDDADEGEISEVGETYRPRDVEEDVEEYWRDTGAYEETKQAHDEDPDLYFLDGPPYTSGQMHLGTAWNKTLKDCFIRYKRMQGYDVHDQPGYDMHGLPIEVKVEEELGFENKSDIEEYGVESFIDDCKEFATDNLEAMNEDFQSMGVWMDWDDPYRTLDPEYMEGAWWAFQKTFERGLVERGKRVINQCPRCETAIADAEVEYDEITSPSIYVEFPLVDDEDDASLVIWTTTPWTIPANLYVAVDEDLEYSKVEAHRDGERDVLVVASDCLEDVLGRGRYEDYTVLETYSGGDIVGRRYRHPLESQVPKQKELDMEDGVHEVYSTDFVSAERTGLVHAAPGHGVDDFEFGEEAGLPVFSPVDTTGVYTDEAGEYAGEFVRDANPDVIEDLDSRGLLVSEDSTSHRYGHCWRCDTPIVFTATDQWFITVTDVKDRLLEELEESEWHPEWARDNRFRDWVENARDWNVSRQRYWGIPVPIWICGEGHWSCIGTREELRSQALDSLPDVEDLDLHRPDVDEIQVECYECGEPAERVEDVFDVWLDSAAASWASLGYPGEDEPFDSIWPAELIIEAHDQTRGWFWTQLGMSVAALDETPYEEVVMHGHALDEDGLKMSKSRGNIVTPQEAIERYGVDPLRSFLLSHDQQGDDMRFSWSEIEAKQRTLNVVWNTHRFPLPYMQLDGFQPEDVDVHDAELSTVDRWVLSRLQSTKQEVEDAMEGYKPDEAQRALLDYLTEDVSRYYVQVVRPRMWMEEDSESKQAAYATLYRVLDECSRLLAPYTPYVAERIHQNLGGETTVHALSWPEVDEELLDRELESDVEVLRELEESAANARQRVSRKHRWPVKRVVVESTDEGVEAAVERHRSLLLDRLNAKDVEVTESWSELEMEAEPQMDVLGPEYGGDAGEIAEEIRGSSPGELEDGVDYDGEHVDVTDDMVEYRDETPEEVGEAEFSDGRVFVDASLDREIESEGYSRELVRRIQEMRKEMDLDVEERIEVVVDFADERVEELAMERREFVAEEVRAEELRTGSVDDVDYREHWTLEDADVEIGVSRL